MLMTYKMYIRTGRYNVTYTGIGIVTQGQETMTPESERGGEKEE